MGYKRGQDDFYTISINQVYGACGWFFCFICFCVCFVFFTIAVSLVWFKLGFCTPVCMTEQTSTGSCERMPAFPLPSLRAAELACQVVLSLWWTGLVFLLFFKKNRQICKGQCISLFLFPSFLFFSPSFLSSFLGSGMFAFPRGGDGMWSAGLTPAMWQRPFCATPCPCQTIMCSILAITTICRTRNTSSLHWANSFVTWL